MPGVPSGRGCDGCRKQKKKCDQAEPACSRCARLSIPCIGAGTQRYKFKDEGARLSPSSSSRSETLSPARSVPRSPTNDATALATGFVNAISANTDMRFNLVWSFGNYLQHIPSRLGISKALDSSVDALTDVHSSVCRLEKPSPSSFSKYSRALRQLHDCLNDPAKAVTTETLAAVSLMLLCQYLLGISNWAYTSHGEGAAQILKFRGRYYDPNDEFESKLLLSLRGPVVFEGCFNARIQFTKEEWTTLVRNHLDATQPESRMMLCIARIPDFMRRGRAVLAGQTIDPTLVAEMQENHSALNNVQTQLLTHVAALAAKVAPDAPPSDQMNQYHCVYQRLYCLTLIIGIVVNLVLGAVDSTLIPALEAESEGYVMLILSMWKDIAKFKPMGSMGLQLFFNIAWSGTTAPAMKWEIERVMNEAHADFVFGNSRQTSRMELQIVEDYLRLR